MTQRSVEFDCHTRSPLNGSQGVSHGARAAHRRYKGEQQEATAAALATLSPPEREVDTAEGRVRNRWRVVLTRIAIGVMDPGMPIPGSAARTCSDGPFKAIQDTLATWAGQPDERRPSWASWEYRQEPPAREKFGDVARAVYRVRIELRDDDTAPDRIVSLAETHAAGRLSKMRVKRAISKATRGRPTALDLRDAYLAVVQGAPGAVANARALLPTPLRHPTLGAVNMDAGGLVLRAPIPSTRKENRKPAPDPGEEQAACMLRACSTCGAAEGAACKGPGQRFYGVHKARAMDAGVWCSGLVARVTNGVAKGPRKLAAKVSLEAWVVLPWDRECTACDSLGLEPESLKGRAEECRVCAGFASKMVRWPALDGADPPAVTWMKVPEKHRRICAGCLGTGCWGAMSAGGGPCPEPECKGGRIGRIKMIRRAWTRAGKACWLYEPAGGSV